MQKVLCQIRHRKSISWKVELHYDLICRKMDLNRAWRFLRTNKISFWKNSSRSQEFCSGGASHWRCQSSIFSFFAQRSFRCHSSITGLLQQDMTSNIFYQSASNSWNWYEALATNLSKFVSGGGHGLILAAYWFGGTVHSTKFVCSVYFAAQIRVCCESYKNECTSESQK